MPWLSKKNFKFILCDDWINLLHPRHQRPLKLTLNEVLAPGNSGIATEMAHHKVYFTLIGSQLVKESDSGAFPNSHNIFTTSLCVQTTEVRRYEIDNRFDIYVKKQIICIIGGTDSSEFLRLITRLYKAHFSSDLKNLSTRNSCSKPTWMYFYQIL